jgi:beta-lactamase superfamily II metal-dependent hydrolase
LCRPADNEIEISIFGPGFGECIIVHAGFNEWIVIDSCIESESGRPAALIYLESRGVDPATAVKFILCTHWHDDHVGGMSHLLRACESARFACSSALTRTEFLDVVQAFNKRPLIASTSGLTEISKVLSILRARGQVPKYAIADRSLLRLMRPDHCELTALSPSDAEFQRFIQGIGKLVPEVAMAKFRLPSPSENDISVATWLRVGSLRVLLGADLEEHGVAGRGWTAVLASPPAGQASAFKISHHGSITAHHPGIWSDLLEKAALAVLTPWNLGSKLPSDEDCQRIMQLTPSAYATSRPGSRRIKVHQRAVARTIREAGIAIREIEPRTGSVQLRASLDDPDAGWTLTLSPEALPLDQYHS